MSGQLPKDWTRIAAISSDLLRNWALPKEDMKIVIESSFASVDIARRISDSRMLEKRGALVAEASHCWHYL
jgi:hypothetical protein